VSEESRNNLNKTLPHKETQTVIDDLISVKHQVQMGLTLNSSQNTPI